MATKIKFKKIKNGDRKNFVDHQGKTKFLQEVDIQVNDSSIGRRLAHTGNSNYIMVKEVERQAIYDVDERGEKVTKYVDVIKERGVIHPIGKFVRRGLNAIR